MTVPRHLSPSAMSTFEACPLSYRYQYVERRESAPSPEMALGTLAHRALQHLLWRPADGRTIRAAREDLDRAREELVGDPGFALDLAPDEWAAFDYRANQLITNYFWMEDPTEVDAIGVELRLEVDIAGVSVHGIIDRLDRTADGLVIVDYKGGKAPRAAYEQNRLKGVVTYAYMVEQLFGARPVELQLLYLATCERISTPIPPSRGVEMRVGGIWRAVQRALERDDFRPRPSKLCDWCSFRDECPAWADVPRRD